MSSPLEGLSQAEADDLLVTVGDEYDKKFRESFEQLQHRLLAVEPVLLLSSFAFYALFTPPDHDPELTQDEPLLQHHVELLQGLILRHAKDAFDTKPVVRPQDFQAIRDLVYATSQAFNMRRFADIRRVTTKEDRHRLRAVEQIRVHTQVVRNWGYPHQIKHIAAAIFAPHDDEIERRIGVRMEYLVEMGFNLVDLVERRINEHRNALRPMLRAKKLTDVVEQYYRAFPSLKDTPEELTNYLKKHKATLSNAKELLFSHSSLWLPQKFTFTLDDFISAYPGEVSPQTMLRVLDGWAISFGEIADQDPEHLFMANPIWRRPIIKTRDDGSYFMPIPVLFISFCLDLMERVLGDESDLRDWYVLRRGDFLEDQIEQQFRAAFPDARVYRGSLWDDPSSGKEYENDLLVSIDSYMIVVEAKAGKVSEPARRGAERRLGKTIEELIVEPSAQAKRFADFLQANPGQHTFATRRGVENHVDNTEIYKTIRLNVTLDPIATLQSRWTDLRMAGFVPDDADLAPTMTLSDLENVFELLEGACEKIHYLVRRAEFEANANYVADELDLLAFYLETGFNIGESEHDGSGLFLYGMSKSHERYFMRSSTGLKARKPRRRLTKWWRDILSRVEMLTAPRWTESGYILLNVPSEDQARVEHQFRTVKRIVRERWRSPGHLNSVVLITGPPQRRDALVALAYKHLEREERNKLIETVAMQAIAEEPIDRALVIGVDIERNSYPYSVLACLLKGEEIAPVAEGAASPLTEVQADSS
jgi:hypothetical protein